MDIIDKTRITKNLVVLLKETQYHALISSIERLDKKNLIPEKLMTFWKKRPTFGYNLEQLNRQFYSDIQCRGPEAFQLLIKGLQESGHQNMVKLLVPTLRIHESESDEVLPVEYYDNEGTNFAFIDDNWKGIPCRSDREAIKLFFAQLGYRELRVLDDLQACGDIASLVVVNFSSFSNGGVSQETEWIYDRFNQESLASKPKILISLRYLNKKLNGEVQQDNGGTKLIRKFFRDMLQVKITVDSSKRHDGEKSEEVRHLLRVFSEDDSLHLEDKIRKLQGEFKRNQLHPLEMQDSDFSKAFRLKKC